MQVAVRNSESPSAASHSGPTTSVHTPLSRQSWQLFTCKTVMLPRHSQRQ